MNELNENLNELIESSPTLLLQFGDENCGPCHAIHFKLDRWLAKHPKTVARYIDIPSHLELCSQMGIMTAPAILIYMDGKLAVQAAGYFSLDGILGRVDRYTELREQSQKGNY